MANTLDTARTRLALLSLATIFTGTCYSTIENGDIGNSINYSSAALITILLLASSFCCPDLAEQRLANFNGYKRNRDDTVTSTNTWKSRFCLLWLAELTSYVTAANFVAELESDKTTEQFIGFVISLVSFTFAFGSLFFLIDSFCRPQNCESELRDTFSRNPYTARQAPDPLQEPLNGDRDDDTNTSNEGRYITDNHLRDNPFDQKATANTEYDRLNVQQNTQQEANYNNTGHSEDAGNDLRGHNHHDGDRATAPRLAELNETIIGQSKRQESDEGSDEEKEKRLEVAPF